MIKNYFKIAWRNLGKNKGYTFVNIAGLGIAFACSILIFLFCSFQFSFDEFHADKDRIYQTYLNVSTKEGIKKSGGMCFPFAPALKADYPEVEKAARIMGIAGVVRYKDKVYESEVSGTDQDLLDLFSFPMMKGSKSSALNGLSNIIISETAASKIFDKEDPMDKMVQVQIDHQWKDFVVTGVLKDYPANSSIRFEGFVRIENAPGYTSEQNNWSAYNHFAYVKLKPSVTAAAFEKKAQPLLEKYFKGNSDDAKKEGVAPDKNGHYTSLGLLPLTDIHFATDVLGNGAPKALIYTMMSIAAVILLIASFNFVNLSIALSITRAKEMGVRKSLGAQKSRCSTNCLGNLFWCSLRAGWQALPVLRCC